MALTAATGLSAAQKDRLQNSMPEMDVNNAIPAAIATKTDVDTVISDLASTSADKGASQVGIQDAGALITATTVEGALAELAVAPPAAHAASHTDGTDDIQSATAAQKGLATAAQITKLDAIEALADVTDEANVLAALAVGATAKDMGGGAITNVGNVDGRDVSADGTKLDGIEALADVTDLTNVTSALGATAATAVTSTTGGAGNDGKLIKLDGTGKVDGYSATNWDLIAGHEAALAASAATTIGLTRHILVEIANGATRDIDTALPPGTWEPIDAWVVNEEASVAADSIQLVAQGVGTITEDMSSLAADQTVLRPVTFNRTQLVGGTNALRCAVTAAAGAAPAQTAHFLLRQVA